MKPNLNTTNLLVIFFVLGVHSLASSQENYKKLLTNQTWKLTEWTIKDPQGQEEDLLRSLDECERDNTITYRTNSSFLQTDEGIICSSTSNTTIGEGTWRISKDGKLLTETFLGGKPSKKQIVDISALKLYLEQFESDGTVQRWQFSPYNPEEINKGDEKDLVQVKEESKTDTAQKLTIEEKMYEYEDSVLMDSNTKMNYDDREFVNLGITTGFWKTSNHKYKNFKGGIPILLYYENSGDFWNYDFDFIPSYIWEGGYIRYRNFKSLEEVKDGEEEKYAPKIFGFGIRGGIDLATLTNIATKQNIFSRKDILTCKSL